MPSVKIGPTSLFTIALLLLSLSSLSNSLPLSTHGRWIIDATSGNRVKLRCVNWVAHMEPMLAEGLDKKPLKAIVAKVSSLGFNCVRLTWSTFMFTRTHYSNLTVTRSLERLGLGEAVAMGVAKFNPGLVNLSVVQAYDAVVDEIGGGGLMVVLDNHVSRPKWCCGFDDGNGFFGDRFFDPKEWLNGLLTVATRFKDKPQVVGISMRNELRGRRQNVQDWYRYIQRGVTIVHNANPNALLMVSGLSYDTDLSFIAKHEQAIAFGVNNKLVYEVHWYSFSDRKRRDWEVQEQISEVCSNSIVRFKERAGFLLKDESTSDGVPLFVSEFGVDQRGLKRGDNMFLSCFLGYMAEKDLDWSMWALQGSYYLRNGRAGFEETYGVLDANWDTPKNHKFQQRFRLILHMIQDPSSKEESYHIMYHPLSGKCVWVNKNNIVQASDCGRRSQWNFTGNGSPIRLIGTNLCLQANEDGRPVTLSTGCSSKKATWTVDSSFKLRTKHIDAQGRSLCLENNPSKNSSEIFTNHCLCSNYGSICDKNPQIQWFRFIKANMI